MISNLFARFPHWICPGIVAGLACVLYWPFLGNPRVFDDWVFFSGAGFSYYATHPFGLAARVPPFFSLAITEIFLGSMQAHRIVSLVLHVACALALYKLMYELLRAGVPDSSASQARSKAAGWAFMAATAFAIHPVAVYGAAYLVQRSIVLATLFSLLSLVLFARGLV